MHEPGIIGSRYVHIAKEKLQKVIVLFTLVLSPVASSRHCFFVWRSDRGRLTVGVSFPPKKNLSPPRSPAPRRCCTTTFSCLSSPTKPTSNRDGRQGEQNRLTMQVCDRYLSHYFRTPVARLAPDTWVHARNCELQVL